MIDESLQAEADRYPWYHSIELGDGVVTKGLSKIDIDPNHFPDLRDKSVIDIGTWDGKNAFTAEKMGASRVVGLDHYVWGLNFAARDAYWKECEAAGIFPDHSRDESDFWHPDSLPGKQGFDFAHRTLESSVEAVVGDFMNVDLDSLGTFDVSLYLGVLYHMREPYTALSRLRQITTEVAVIETEAVHLSDCPDEPMLKFFAGNELGDDFGNWFGVSESALHGMCKAAGFRSVTTTVGPPNSTLGPRSLARRVDVGGPDSEGHNRAESGSRTRGLPHPRSRLRLTSDVMSKLGG